MTKNGDEKGQDPRKGRRTKSSKTNMESPENVDTSDGESPDEDNGDTGTTMLQTVRDKLSNKKKKKRAQLIGIRLPDELLKKIDKEAQRLNVSRNAVITMTLETVFDE
ncbi:MAG: CopG family transcriptional regulator [Oligoflexales bacterium]|nr:CopG family transcriptional regulator [Oligoflexales bacterium]